MKPVLTSLLLFFTLNLSAQYKLDIGLGYDYPNFKFEDYGPLNKFQNRHFKGIHAHVGLQQEFNASYSQNYGVGHLIRDAKKTDPIKTTFFRNIDLKFFYLLNIRRILEPESLADDVSDGGYSYNTYSTNQDKYFSIGVGIGFAYSKNRFYTTLDGSWETYSKDFYSIYRETDYHPHLPWGTIDDYYQEADYLSASFQRIRIAAGIGVKIFHPKSKINIIPSIKLVQGFIINQQIEKNYLVTSSVYNWDGNPNPNTNYAWDSTSYPSRFSINKFAMDFLIGSTFTAQIMKRVQLNCDLFYGLGSGPIISNSKNPFFDKLRFSGSLGLGYRFSLKDKAKPNENY